ncbi:MAG: hypothetical protein GVY36_11780 [Verrucomicrobia bacterium]|nr:hypothetical protein [Verrucomicrobiota bacterium]
MSTLLEQLGATTALQWIAMAAGILGVWLSIKEKVAAWPLFILCYGCYLYLYFGNLNAFAGMNGVFILISIYGWIRWAKVPGATTQAIPITRTPRAHWPIIGAVIVVATGGIGWLLSQSGEANVPYIDAFATLCAFVAQWMLSRKQIETWIFWLISDMIYLVLVFQQQDWPTVLLFTIFIYLAWKGLRDWARQLD